MSVTQDWRFKNECFPFEDENNYYITVESEYETPGDAKESRLAEAQRDGVFKLLKFYGKDTTDVFEEQDGIFDASSVEDYYVSYRPCVRMKVLVSVPKKDFDSILNDPTACEINKPAEGYLSAFIPIANAGELIDSVADRMLSLVQHLYRSDRFISNVNIVREINRLRAAGRAIQRYIDLNEIPSKIIEDPECVQPNEFGLELEIGFSYNYDAIFALVDGDQYTIGYDCFLEHVNLNHETTIYFLLYLQQMLEELQLINTSNFDVFSFFQKYVKPAPVIETKQDPLDGLNKYGEDGELNVLANLAKLITLDLDINLCKTAEEKAAEDRTLLNQETLNKIDQARKQTKDAVGNNTLSAGGRERLRERLNNIGETVGGGNALNVLFEDVLAKVDLACVLEESIQCVTENMITRFGQEVFDDPDLEEVFRIQKVSLGSLNNNCSLDTEEGCDGTPDVGLKIGLPVFQGINIPENLPTLDFLADTIDIALQNLYNRLVNTLATTTLGIFESTCDLILSLPDGLAGIPGQLEEWLSNTLGVDLDTLKDPQAFADALRSNSGTGFVGIIGKAASRVEGAVLDTYSETGIALNLPNQSGQVEEVFVSPEFFVNWIKGTSDAVKDAEAVLTPSETQSLFKGTARPEVLELAYKCATRNSTELFPTQQDFEDAMYELGNIVDPSFLTEDLETLTTVASNYCELGDNTSSNSLRQYLLSNKDSNMSSQQIDEILEKEKQRAKTRLLESLDTLQQVQAGTLAPSFPSIFGRGGLIPETPPVISEIQSIVIQGSLNSVMYNFNSEITSYSEIYKEYFEDNTVRFPLNVNQVVIDGTNSLQYIYDGTSFGGDYIIGYEISEEEIPAESQERSDVIELGPYTFGGDIDITGISKLSKKSNRGESQDDALFEDLVKDLEPYVANSTHTFDSKYFKDFKKGIGKLEPEELGPEYSISGARAYAYLLMVRADRFQAEDQGDNNQWKELNPYWESHAFRDQEPQLFQTKLVLDNRNDKKNTNEVTIRVREFSEPVKVEARNPTRITRTDVSPYQRVETKPLFTDQNTEDYAIGNTATLLGRKIATGALLDETYNYAPFAYELDLLSVADLAMLAPIGIFAENDILPSEKIYNSIAQNLSDQNFPVGSFAMTRHEVIRKYMKDFFDYMNRSKYYQSENQFDDIPEAFDNINLTFPDNDVLQYNKLQQFGLELLPILNEKLFNNEYCDTLSSTRRINSIMCARMLVRLQILELMLISIQTFDVFDLRFMECDYFTSSIYNKLKTELSKYNASFDTIETDLYSELVDAISRYYEIVGFEQGTTRDILRDFVFTEIQEILPSIQSSLNLTVGTNNTNWNEYIAGTLIPEKIHTQSTPTSGVITTGPYVFVKNVQGDVYSYELRIADVNPFTEDDVDSDDTYVVLSQGCIKENIEEGSDIVIDDFTRNYGPFEPFSKKLKWDTKTLGNNDIDIYRTIVVSTGLSEDKIQDVMTWLETVGEREENTPWAYRTKKFDPNNDRYKHNETFVYEALDGLEGNLTIEAQAQWVWSEKTYTVTIPATVGRDLKIDVYTEEIAEVYLKLKVEDGIAFNLAEQDFISAKQEIIWGDLKKQLLETEEFKYIFNDFIPLKTMISSMTVYQYSALSDSAIFSSNISGVNLFDMLTNTKLSTLQIFAASIYGGGKISYQDPFLEEAGTDQVF